jgi:hypothetical protein
MSNERLCPECGGIMERRTRPLDPLHEKGNPLAFMKEDDDRTVVMWTCLDCDRTEHTMPGKFGKTWTEIDHEKVKKVKKVKKEGKWKDPESKAEIGEELKKDKEKKPK